jgi:hypothetical protein
MASIDSFRIQKSNGVHLFYIQSNGTNLVAGVRHKDHFKVSIGKQAHTAYKIPIDKIPCHYGGFRSYFRCPLCDSRSRMLYFDEKSLLLCRKCLNLSYESQQLRPTLRLYSMTEKIKKMVNEKGGDLKFNEKPPKMHTATYKRLRNKLFDYEGKEEQARMNEMVQWFGAERVSKFFDL